jgi:hypothetical protein
MNQIIEWKKTQPGSSEAVQFSDGMLVTAEDLNAAMRYPLSVVQVLLRAFFGCGIVCGLDLKNPAEKPATDGTYGQPAPAGSANRPPECDPNFILTIEKGVALGCDGYPIEICGPLKLDLTPDPCRLDRRPKAMFIATRRVTAAEAAARACGCGSSGGEAAPQCTRVRDHALVQAFEEDRLPADICRIPKVVTDGVDAARGEGVPAQRPTSAPTLCDCLKQCGECACCGEPWVLLGSVVVSEAGLGTIDMTGRRYVKPIACACDAVARDQAPPAVVAEPRTAESRIVAEPATGESPAPAAPVAGESARPAAPVAGENAAPAQPAGEGTGA